MQLKRSGWQRIGFDAGIALKRRTMASEKKTLLEMLGVPSLAPELKNSAVIIIDAQREYLDGRVPLVGIEAALEEIKKTSCFSSQTVSSGVSPSTQSSRRGASFRW